ncbi:hypothetical protein AVEN_107801-1 [Araneus ventricosus]|uniref:DUF4817 domain-containing protein n=1 Tax=Araneus ventricosus TaxID=182803 RepID=A0A4Y2WRX6_ARAVE|nr:hypothetical protein AVEN_37653-1 [Araneus ventricosus]GBO39960.1 hypothetical protein AVEN_107801-1 [Araneus ventricosus]
MYPCALRKMIQKFETTGQLGIVPGRGRKQIPSSSVEDVAPAVVEASSQSPHGQRYRDMLRDFLIPQLQQRGCLQDIIFMHDGAPPHIDRQVKQLLRQHFTDERVLSLHFPTSWAPRSPDITPCHFC